MDAKNCIFWGALVGSLGVAAGALGAHALQTRLSVEQLQTYEIGVRYQLVHALALVLVGVLSLSYPSTAAQVAGWAYLVGTALFSGCLYSWVFTHFKPLVHLVPVGGVSLIIGWLALAIAGWAITGRP